MVKLQQLNVWLPGRWVLVNLAVLPFAGLAIFVIAGFSTWGTSFNGFELQAWAECLPLVAVAGGLCGVALGLVQGWSLHSERIKIANWAVATSLGMALDAVLAYGAWQLLLLAGLSTLPLPIHLFVYTIFALLAVFHGCSLAAVQWFVMRRRGYVRMGLWPWLAGVSWSFLTPFLYGFTINYWTSMGDVLLGEYLATYLPFLLFSLPYIVLTTVLWRREVQ